MTSTRFNPGDDVDNGSYEDHDDEASALLALSRLEEVIARISWFSRLGRPLDDTAHALAQTYLDQLGFPDATPVMAGDWEEAAFAAENIDLNSEAWEVEEQLRADLSREALLYSEEAALADALDQITQLAGSQALEAAQTAATLWPIDDDATIEVAVGQAVQAAYHAGLVLAAQAVENHPFALRFQLFEYGHWPIALTGRSFHIF